MIVKSTNFRSLRAVDLELAPMTILYGANGSGKSSLLYTLAALRNIILDPNRQSGGFFNLDFINLGGFEEVVFDHQKEAKIELGLTVRDGQYSTSYTVSLNDTAASFSVRLSQDTTNICTLLVDAALPYPLNTPTQTQFEWADFAFTATFNGVMVTGVQADDQANKDALALAAKLHERFNQAVEQVRVTGMVPLRRGFTKAHYSQVAIGTVLTNEDEVATLLATDGNLLSKVSWYLKKIVNRDLRYAGQPGAAIFQLLALDNSTGVSTALVNEGFGVNQLVDMLTRILHQGSTVMSIEEPEIHLHPTAVRQAARVFAEIARTEGRRFIISTHSEAFLLALLSEVAEGKMSPSDLSCYYVHKEGRETWCDREEVNDKGQISGGLASFIGDEIDDIRPLLGISAEN